METICEHACCFKEWRGAYRVCLTMKPYLYRARWAVSAALIFDTVEELS